MVDELDGNFEESETEALFPSQTEVVWSKPVHSSQLLCAIIESILTSSITVWFGRVKQSDFKKLSSVIRSAEKIICGDLINGI